MKVGKWSGVLPSAALILLLLMAGCNRGRTPEPTSEPTATPTVVPSDTPTPRPTATPTPAPPTFTPTSTTVPITDADLEGALDLVSQALTKLAEGNFREVYGSYLTVAGQQRLADLVLGRLALSNPHISYFELLGAEMVDKEAIAVDVVWQETYEGQGVVGSQEARFILTRQDGAFLIDDVEMGQFEPAATPVPPAMPQAQVLSNPAYVGQEMRFRATDFEAGETVLAWLELPDGELKAPTFVVADGEGSLEVTYPAEVTEGLAPGRWIWWAQALRDSTRNAGITFDALLPPTPTATPTPTPTRPRPTPRPPTPTPTPTQPSMVYGPPTVLWPEPETSRNFGSALVVEFVPVADELAADEFYQLVLEARDQQGHVYHAGAVVGKGKPCSTPYSQPCLTLVGDERFMRLFHLKGTEGRGSWFIQVVKQTGPNEYTPISPPSETRIVILKPRD